MPSLNQCQLIGRLTRDPERVETSSDLSIVRFAIAVDRQFKDRQTGEKKTDFFDCTAFRQTADFVDQYIRKGNLVALVGSIEIDEAQNREGVKMKYTKIVAQSVQNLSPKGENEDGSDQEAAPPRQQQQQAPPPRAARPAAPRPSVPPTRKPAAVAAGNADDLDDSDPFADD